MDKDAGIGTVFADAASDLFGAVFWWFILAIFLLFMTFMFFQSIVKRAASPFLGKRERFELPTTTAQGGAPSPCPEHDERCAQFPAL